jgi:hypothetical protein
MERCCLALGLFALATHACALQRQLDEQAPRLARRDARCNVEQFEAANASDNLRSPDPAWREWGLSQFKSLDLGGWQMGNMCAAVSVGATCDDHDLPCQLAALDWAMVNIR